MINTFCLAGEYLIGATNDKKISIFNLETLNKKHIIDVEEVKAFF